MESMRTNCRVSSTAAWRKIRARSFARYSVRGEVASWGVWETASRREAASGASMSRGEAPCSRAPVGRQGGDVYDGR